MKLIYFALWEKKSSDLSYILFVNMYLYWNAFGLCFGRSGGLFFKLFFPGDVGVD